MYSNSHQVGQDYPLIQTIIYTEHEYVGRSTSTGP
jgi:hypothetical protein